MRRQFKKIKPAGRVEGVITLPGDKSISHRAVMIGSIAHGETRIENFLDAEDCVATLNAFKKMGLDIRVSGGAVVIRGAGLKGLKKPVSDIYLGNSGTSMRLLLGILAGQDFESVLTGDDSLNGRPMGRVTVPLRRMGADIRGRDEANFAPLTVKGARLRGIDYVSPVASAQVKSSILFAGLSAEGVTSVTEPFRSRDHTERMLALFGGDISTDGLKVSVRPSDGLVGKNICIPGDISSAAFFIVAAMLLSGSEITIRDLGCNGTRTGVIDILRRMGGRIELGNTREGWEPVCDLTVRSGGLRATTIEKSEIPRAIDEIPALMVAAVFAKGRTVIKGAAELRVKETDRIASMLHNLGKMGASVVCEGDDVIIEGTGTLRGSEELSSFKDHRTAMAVAVAGLCAASGESVIDETECVNTSFPGFFDIMGSVAVD